LITVTDNAQYGLYGTFTLSNEKERTTNNTTASFWSFLSSNLQEFKNPLYVPNQDVLYPDTNLYSINLWNYYLQSMTRKQRKTIVP